MSMTFAQAEMALASGAYNTVALITDLVKQVSGAVEGATSQTTYLLYNGKMPSGEFASEAASAVRAR